MICLSIWLLAGLIEHIYLKCDHSKAPVSMNRPRDIAMQKRKRELDRDLALYNRYRSGKITFNEYFDIKYRR